MTTPLTPPQFGDKFSVPPTDIGSGYAAGITSAGQSIAGAIGSVMGGYNQRTGEVQPGILDQKQSSEDTLDMMYAHGMMTQEEYEKAKSSGLSAQQKWIGQATSEFNTKLQAQLQLKQATMEQSAATGRQGLSSGTQVQTTQMQEQAALQRQREAQQAQVQLRKPFVVPNPNAQTVQPAPLPPLKLNTGY